MFFECYNIRGFGVGYLGLGWFGLDWGGGKGKKFTGVTIGKSVTDSLLFWRGVGNDSCRFLSLKRMKRGKMEYTWA